MRKLSPESEVFTRAVDAITTRDELKELLAAKKQLRIKYGVDITAQSLHIGHAVNLWKMRELQEYGHKIIFLIGDFTTRIGDPTGRLETRKKIETKDITAWSRQFIDQISSIIKTNKDVFEVRHNSEWYEKMKTGEFFTILSFVNHARLVERDMFKKRIQEGKEITMPEFLYPVLQAYDSVMIQSDMTIIGSDQLFNETIGRVLQEKFNQKRQVLVTTAITPGLDGGPKMSKSLGNAIFLDDTAQDIFGKAMRLPDNLVMPYLEVYTEVSSKDVEKWRKKLNDGDNPMGVKLFFAEELVARYYGRDSAKKTRDEFLRIFSNRQIPSDIAVGAARYGMWDPLELLIALSLVKSRSEGRRLLNQKAIDIDGSPVSIEVPIEIQKGAVVRVGKRRFVKIQ